MTTSSPSNEEQPRPQMSAAVTVFLGPGGVGKTTMAAAYGIAAARRGEKVVVLTIDPARRLANTLGMDSEGLGHTVTEVAGDWPGQLWATMLDPAEMFRTIVDTRSTSPEQQQRILNNRIFQSLSNSLSGTHEYMACERLHELIQSGQYDRIVLDTPPAKHAFDFLDSPQRLTSFLDHRLYRLVFRPKSTLLKTLNVAAQRLLRLLGGLVGTDLVDDVVEFFAEFDGLDRGFSERAHAIETLLDSPDTSYVLVTSPRSEPLRESRWISQALETRNRHCQTIIANRTTPIAIDDDSNDWAAASDFSKPLEQNFWRLHQLAVAENTELETLAGAMGQTATPLIRVTEQAEPVHHLTGLSELATYLAEGTNL